MRMWGVFAPSVLTTHARAVLELKILIDELLTTREHCYVSSP